MQLRKQMVAQCKGLPLAIVVLGGILAPKRRLEEWKNVHNNIVTFFKNSNDEENGVTGVLELSYTDLPFHLRPCFLHLGNFPEDYEIPTKKLYRMWIAEGIVAPRDDKPADLENIANSYLQELVQRCIVQVGKRGPAGKIKTCRLHDLMWEMCTSKAKEESFLSIVRQGNTSEGYNYNSSAGIRFGKLHRLAIHFGQSLQSIFPCQQFNKASHLRSLMFFSIGPVNEGDQGWLKAILNEFKLLRVLDLEHTGIEEVPKEIGTLIHLRYLSIMGTQVSMLPSSIGKLRCLQTLDLRVSRLPYNRVMKIPNVLWRMKRLKHLYLPSHPDNFTLTRIPNVSWRKKRVKHLYFRSHTNNRVMRISNFLAKRFQKLRIKGLSNLEILKNFDTRRYRVNDLRKLENLRKLSIKNEISKAETLKIILECQSIKNHNHMRFSLKIHASVLNEDPTILQSCSCLHTLEMAGTESPLTELRLDKDNVMFPEKLMILKIKNCKFMCADPVKNIEQLRNLTTLSLHNVSFPENCMDFSNASFLQLVHLKLSNMKTLKEWRVGAGTMPKLHRLQIEYCDENLMIPDGLPTSVEVVCHPCVRGFDKYCTCPFVSVVDDDDDDFATQYCTNILS